VQQTLFKNEKRYKKGLIDPLKLKNPKKNLSMVKLKE